jgi:hypothetical protein
MTTSGCSDKRLQGTGVIRDRRVVDGLGFLAGKQEQVARRAVPRRGKGSDAAGRISSCRRRRGLRRGTGSHMASTSKPGGATGRAGSESQTTTVMWRIHRSFPHRPTPCPAADAQPSSGIPLRRLHRPPSPAHPLIRLPFPNPPPPPHLPWSAERAGGSKRGQARMQSSRGSISPHGCSGSRCLPRQSATVRNQPARRRCRASTFGSMEGRAAAEDGR